MTTIRAKTVVVRRLIYAQWYFPACVFNLQLFKLFLPKILVKVSKKVWPYNFWVHSLVLVLPIHLHGLYVLALTIHLKTTPVSCYTCNTVVDVCMGLSSVKDECPVAVASGVHSPQLFTSCDVTTGWVQNASLGIGLFRSKQSTPAKIVDYFTTKIRTFNLSNRPAQRQLHHPKTGFLVKTFSR